MNQGQLARAISKKFHLTRTESRKIIKFILSEIKEDIRNGRRVYFRGFGSFQKVIKAPRKGRDLKARCTIGIPSRPDVDFNPSKLLLKVLK